MILNLLYTMVCCQPGHALLMIRYLFLVPQATGEIEEHFTSDLMELSARMYALSLLSPRHTARSAR